MAVNMYDQAAEAPILNTYVPINFNELYRIGQSQQEAVEEAQNLLTNALTTFGEFRSPSTTDTENYYNLSIGRFQDIIDAAAADPNLMKDPAFRAGLQQRINSLDYASLSLLRESADNMRKGLEMRAKMMAEGKYNRNWDDANITQYDTLTNRAVFDDITPVAYTDANTLSNKYFDNLEQGYIGSGYEDGVKYNYYGNTRDDLMQIANARYNDLVNTPQGQKYYEQFLRQSGGNADAAREAFVNMIADSQMDRTIRPNREVDPLWLIQAKENARRTGQGDTPTQNNTRLDFMARSMLNNTTAGLERKFGDWVNNLSSKNDSRSNAIKNDIARVNYLKSQVDEAHDLAVRTGSDEDQIYYRKLQSQYEDAYLRTMSKYNEDMLKDEFQKKAGFSAENPSDKEYSPEAYLSGVKSALDLTSSNVALMNGKNGDDLLTSIGGNPREFTTDKGGEQLVYDFGSSAGFMLPESVFRMATGLGGEQYDRNIDRDASWTRSSEFPVKELIEGGRFRNVQFIPDNKMQMADSETFALSGKLRIPREEVESKLGVGRWDYTDITNLTPFGVIPARQRTSSALKEELGMEVTKDENGNEFYDIDIYRILPSVRNDKEYWHRVNQRWQNSGDTGIGGSSQAKESYGTSARQLMGY